MPQPVEGFAAGRVKSLFNINPVIRFFDSPKAARDKVGHYVSKGQRVADIACNTGYYTLILAECVSLEGKVYAVDLDPAIIKLVGEKVSKAGYHNIELHNANAADLNFIEDHSIDFVLANGLIWSMLDSRPLAVSEIKRILKPGGRAYLSLGAPPPLGQVNSEEWEETLAGFKVLGRGGFLQKWALVTL